MKWNSQVLLMPVPGLSIWVQWPPPSVVLKMPAPRTASPLKYPSPVPARRVLEALGSMASVLTARLATMSSSVGSQLAPLSVVFHTPPATAAAYIVLGVEGLMTMARVRPPMLPGPRALHVPMSGPPVVATPTPPRPRPARGAKPPVRVEYTGIRAMRSRAAR